MKYRAEIDGLRALAVVPVIFFHAGFELFGGGFIGVDVFFVISGYLITTILIEDIEKNRFSLVSFYERRARRILPALFFVMLVCMPFAWMWMHPSQMKDFSQSLVAVSLFASNVLFWMESGYFATAAEEKPLLHTWSLAVEEQYYVLFPIFLFLAWRFSKKHVFLLIVVLAVISLALSEWGWRNMETANFYLAPTRAWELFAGSIATFVVRKRGVQGNNLLSLLGLAAIMFAIFAYDESTPFPSVYALVPVVGVVFLLLFAQRTTLVGKFLSTKPFVGIGLISYSAYLWHQPLFAFIRINSLEKPSTLSMLFLIVVSMLMAFFSWKFIEQPFRNREFVNRFTIFFMSFMGGSLFIALGLLGHFYWDRLDTGNYNRLEVSLAMSIDGYQDDNRKLQDDSLNPLRRISGDNNYDLVDDDFDDQLWFEKDGDRHRILLIGNSHSKDMFNVLVNSKDVSDRYLITRYGAQIRDLSHSHKFWKSPNYHHSDYLIVVSRYNDRDLDNVRYVVERAIAENKRVVLVKNIFEFEEFRTGNWSLIDKVSFESLNIENDYDNLPMLVNREYHAHYKRNNTSQSVINVNRRLVDLARELDVQVLDRMDYVCESEDSLCYAINQNMEKLFYDYGHHTLRGAEFFGQRVDTVNWLDLED